MKNKTGRDKQYISEKPSFQETINSFLERFSQTQRWYLATILGFCLGYAIGFEIGNIVPQSPLMQWIFWIYPAGGVGLGIALCQWLMIRRTHRYAFLWIPITLIGMILCVGGTLLLIVAVLFQSFYSEDASWLVWLIAVSPVIILLGPLCQWLFLRHSSGDRPFKEVIKISVGWISALLLLYGILYSMLYPSDFSFMTDMGPIVRFIAFIVTAVPSAVIFAWATGSAIDKPSRK